MEPYGVHDNPRAASLEHFWPRSLGGSNRLENLSLAHIRCNQARGDAEPTPEHYRVQGLLLLMMGWTPDGGHVEWWKWESVQS